MRAGAIATGCPCCGSVLNDQNPITGVDRWQGVLGRFEVHTCSNCSAGVTMPLVPENALGEFYPDAYSPHVPPRGLAGAVSAALQRRSLKTAPLNELVSRPAGRLLDVGCGRGDLGAMMIEHGWHVTGLEPSPKACAVAESRGIRVVEGTLGTVQLEPETYDAAVFQNSLEHVSDPLANLEQVRDALVSGGIVVIISPNFDCWESRRFRGRWFHLDLPRHRVHLTSVALAEMFERAGLLPQSIGVANTAVGLPGSLQYALFGRCLFPGGLPLTVATGLAYLVSPLTWLIARLVHSGDILWGVARRP